MTELTALENQDFARLDLKRIAELIAPGSRVLDLGCGDGAFLRFLADTKQVRPLGVEIDPDRIAACVANGIPVVQCDLNKPLDLFDDQSFDYVLLTSTFQELRYPGKLLREIVRVGRTGLVGFINFGLLTNRMQLFWRGRMPLSKQLPHQWYNTPNIHLGTIRDFRALCKECDLVIRRAFPVGHKRTRLDNVLPNLFARACIFEITRQPGKSR